MCHSFPCNLMQRLQYFGSQGENDVPRVEGRFAGSTQCSQRGRVRRERGGSVRRARGRSPGRRRHGQGGWQIAEAAQGRLLNAGLQATWCAQGKQAAEYWGKLFNVDVTWFDGQFNNVTQRAAINNMASQTWDFVAIQAFGIGTLTAPVNKMIEAGIPVIDMDTLIAPLDTINVLTFLAPDNEFMGESVTQALVNAINGEGTIVMTQGSLGHTGAQGEPRASIRSSRSSRRSRFSTSSPPTGTSPRPRASGNRCSRNIRRSTRPSSTMTTWRSPPIR